MDSDFFDENADFDHFSLFLTCFWSVKALVSVSKALNEYICHSSYLIESEWQENFKQH